MGFSHLIKRYIQLPALGLMLITGGWNACESKSSDDAALLAATKSFVLDHAQAKADLAELTQSPHVFGSPRQQSVANYLEKRLNTAGLQTKRQTFTAAVPNPAAANASGPVQLTQDRQGVNLYGFSGVKPKATCVVALASHYDTKDIPGLDYVGANDSGSSTVALLQQLTALKAVMTQSKLDLTCEVIGIFFDGEEAVLPNWHDGLSHPARQDDHTYGSRHAVERLKSCQFAGRSVKCLPEELGGQPIVALVLMDMIGSPNMRLTRDSQSSDVLITLAAAAAKALGSPEAYGQNPKPVEDDHIPFVKAGIASIDLIDFNNLDYWHREGDSASHVSMESIDLAAKIALYTALAASRNPQVLIP